VKFKFMRNHDSGLSPLRGFGLRGQRLQEPRADALGYERSLAPPGLKRGIPDNL
jgi:hypothetical protein